MQKKVAVILSGCGVYDGAEIHESVLTLLRLDQRGAQVQCFAPDIAQHHVINHLTGEEMPESRNVLIESARIARGEVKDIREANADDFDALIIPALRLGKKPLGPRSSRPRLPGASRAAGAGRGVRRSRQTGRADLHHSGTGRQDLRPWRHLHHRQRS